MSIFDFAASQARATRRLAAAPKAGRRRPRSDRGTSRVDPRILQWLGESLQGYDRPMMATVRRDLARRCRHHGLEPPSRATVYKLLATLPTTTCRVAHLPPAVQQALYNLAPESDVPAHQVAFYCFNYGDLAAISFAAGLPWLALYQARRMPGHRPKSRGLLDAVAHVRGL